MLDSEHIQYHITGIMEDRKEYNRKNLWSSQRRERKTSVTKKQQEERQLFNRLKKKNPEDSNLFKALKNNNWS